MLTRTQAIVLVAASVIVGTVDAKQPIEPPKISPNVNPRAESATAPINMGAIHVGAANTGTFTANHGWIAHQIQLSPGAVEFSASGSRADNTSQDTIVYVFGPLKDGVYPTRSIAFNDDDAGTVASRVRVNIPVGGTYRAAASALNRIARACGLSR